MNLGFESKVVIDWEGKGYHKVVRGALLHTFHELLKILV